MARPSLLAGTTLAQLERMLQKGKSQNSKLQRQRDRIARKLASVDAKIAAINGGPVRGRPAGGGRVRNEMSLADLIHQILTKAGKPTSVGDIMDSVVSSGYRTNAANFRGLVNQTLIKDKRFGKASRGMYQAKK
jgi:hypothetical protein